MVIVLFDTPESRSGLYPLCVTRPVAELRHGLFTLREWVAMKTGFPVHVLSPLPGIPPVPDSDSYYCMDASMAADTGLADQLLQLEPESNIICNGQVLAFHTKMKPLFPVSVPQSRGVSMQQMPVGFSHWTHLVQSNAAAISGQFKWLSGRFTHHATSVTNTIIGDELYCAEGVEMEACTINTKEGPVFIGKNALIMEGSIIRGPVCIGEGAVVKMGARIYGGTTIGPGCTVGGEIKNSILQGFSNKAHDGYLGDSCIGAWCNLGAGTSNSNVKNTAGHIQVWHEPDGQWMDAGQKCGMVMGDYSRTAVNSRINSGTTIGVCCSIHEPEMPPKRLPDFSWGAGGRYELQKALRDIDRWKQWKKQKLTAAETDLLTAVYNQAGD